MPKTTAARAFTSDEVQEKFLVHIAGLIEIWENTDEGSLRARLEGLAHNILAALDGTSAALPGFIVAPAPHSSDRAYCQSIGENFYPESPIVPCDIAGHLHRNLYRYIGEFRANAVQVNRACSRSQTGQRPLNQRVR